MTDLNNLQFAVDDRIAMVDPERDSTTWTTGTITQIDPADASLTYYVEMDGGGTTWCSEEGIVLVERLAGEWDKPIEAMSLGVALRRLREGFTTKKVTLSDMERLSARAVEVWRSQGTPATATGLCSACMAPIVFNTTTGIWDHAEPVEHNTPAIILDA